MTSDKSHAYRQEWREFDRQSKDLDWRKSVWARKLRAEWPANDPGAEAFAHWLRTELGFDGTKCNEMLARAATAAIVRDERTFKQLGGSRAVSWLTELDPKDVAPVIEAAKAERKNVRHVMRERGFVEARHSYSRDAEEMADFILHPVSPTPRRILDIAARHATVKRRVAA